MKWILHNLGTCSIEETQDAIKQYHKGTVLIDVRDIVDGKNKNPKTIKKHLKAILGNLRLGEKVIIRCYAGISRSNAMAVGILMLCHNLSKEDAIDLVKLKVPQTQINQDLLDDILEVIEKVRIHQ